MQVGLAVAMVIAAVVVAVILHKQGSIRRSRGQSEIEGHVRHADWGSAHGVQHSIEAVEAKAAEAAKLGENVIAAVKPIELALKDLNKRVAELHARVDVMGKMLGKLSPRSDEPSPEEKARAAVDAKLEELEPRLKTLTDESSTLKQAVERITTRESAIADTVDTGLVDIQGQIDALIMRLERGEKSRADLSLVASLASVRASSEEIARRVANLERGSLPQAMEPETHLSSTPTSDDLPPTVVAADDVEDVPQSAGEETVAERVDNGGDARNCSTGPSRGGTE